MKVNCQTLPGSAYRTVAPALTGSFELVPGRQYRARSAQGWTGSLGDIPQTAKQ